jgi:adenylate cyclase
MVETILDAGGTVDKFIGDAIMAEFGSPISRGAETDAINAIRAALRMRQALLQLQAFWEQQGQVIFFNGIGINYGEAIAGDIGSYRRREYALIGDAVNVASRVEGLRATFTPIS